MAQGLVLPLKMQRCQLRKTFHPLKKNVVQFHMLEFFYCFLGLSSVYKITYFFVKSRKIRVETIPGIFLEKTAWYSCSGQKWTTFFPAWKILAWIFIIYLINITTFLGERMVRKDVHLNGYSHQKLNGFLKIGWYDEEKIRTPTEMRRKCWLCKPD